jgi:hypothetical protein
MESRKGALPLFTLSPPSFQHPIPGAPQKERGEQEEGAGMAKYTSSAPGRGVML